VELQSDLLAELLVLPVRLVLLDPQLALLVLLVFELALLLGQLLVVCFVFDRPFS
jgi:hypothetical protein